MYFEDRSDAGRKLAEKLQKYRNQDVVIYALPRGGVVLGVEIAKKLNAPLDLLIIRKIGHPLNPEYALCATSENAHAHMVCNKEELAGVDKEWFKNETEKERQEAKRRREVYLKGRSPIPAKGKIAIIVDDGVATGLTMFTAILEIKHQETKKVVVAVPVAPPETANQIKSKVDEFVTLEVPTLLIVGGADYGVIELNQEAYEKLDGEKKLEIVSGATHLFEEPGTLEKVAELAAKWFKRYLS